METITQHQAAVEHQRSKVNARNEVARMILDQQQHWGGKPQMTPLNGTQNLQLEHENVQQFSHDNVKTAVVVSPNQSPTNQVVFNKVSDQS